MLATPVQRNNESISETPKGKVDMLIELEDTNEDRTQIPQLQHTEHACGRDGPTAAADAARQRTSQMGKISSLWLSM